MRIRSSMSHLIAMSGELRQRAAFSAPSVDTIGSSHQPASDRISIRPQPRGERLVDDDDGRAFGSSRSLNSARGSLLAGRQCAWQQTSMLVKPLRRRELARQHAGNRLQLAARLVRGDAASAVR